MKRQLPDGVSPTNDVNKSFSAPDVATPKFNAGNYKSKSKSAASVSDGNNIDPKRFRGKAAGEEIYEDEYVSDEDSANAGAPRRKAAKNSLLIAGVILLFAALGAIIVMNNRGKLPLCSDQPEWNQYNCRVR